MAGAVVRLLLVLGVLAAVGLMGVIRGDDGAAVAFAGGALLLAALFAGKVARGARLPKLTGYLLIGFLMGPAALRLIPDAALDGLVLIKGLAVSLIAMAAGAELNVPLVRRVGGRVLIATVLVIFTVLAVLGAAVFALKPVLPFMAQMTIPQSAAVAAMIASVLVSFSPTVTIAIVAETGAKGPFTEFLMAAVILGDLIVLVLFAVTVGLTQASFGGHFSLQHLLRDVGWEIFGSIGVGVAMGLMMRWYLKRIAREIPLFIALVCFLCAQLGIQLHLSALLTALSAGALVANLDEHQAERVTHATGVSGLPVFAVFFAAAGAGLHLNALKVMGPLALVLVAMRGGLIYLTAGRAVADPKVKQLLWMGLISQAGVTFGLAAIVGRTFPVFGAAVETLIIAVVSLHELIGPVLTRRALARAGEVPA